MSTALPSVQLRSGEKIVFQADDNAGLEKITAAGDVERLPHPDSMRLK